MGERLKVLWWSDTPTCATGFGTVAKNLLSVLYSTNKYDFTCVGINHAGQPYDRGKFPYEIYPAANALAQAEQYKEPYGRQLLLDMAKSGKFDIVYLLNDTFITETFIDVLLQIRDQLPKERKFSIVSYFPIDGTPKESWIKNVPGKVDIPVTYTQYAKRECVKHDPALEDMRVIYHGVDKEIFYPPVPGEDFRQKYFRDHHDHFIILNVNRNQPRKDLYRTFAAFSIFHKKYPKTFLFVLAQTPDVGGDLMEIAKNYGLEWDKDWACPAPGTYGANQGYPVNVVNYIYGASDLVVSSTVGEGWGLSSSEAMACKVPVLFPRNTSLVEIIGEDERRGYLFNSGKDMNAFVCMGIPDNNILRPTADIYDMAEKMEYIHNHYDEAKAKAEVAYDEVWTWNSVGDAWKEVFIEAERLLAVLRTDEKTGRNELCPCGSGKKYKHCHGK